MIGLFDTGHGGLTIYRALAARFPERHFIYLGDHAHAPYGNRPIEEVVALTRRNVAQLFDMGCPLVLLACNTATAVAAKPLQQEWLPKSSYKNNRVLGIVAPTVEVVTGTPWTAHAPRDNEEKAYKLVAIFGTPRTILSNVYVTEIHKRSTYIKVVQQICPMLAGAIEAGASEDVLDAQVKEAVRECMEKTGGRDPECAILACTHFPLVEHLFKKYLPADTQILCQGKAVADSLADYLRRHPEFSIPHALQENQFFTTGDAGRIAEDAARFLGTAFPFRQLAKAAA